MVMLNRKLIDFFFMLLSMVMNMLQFLCWYLINGLCCVIVCSLIFFLRQFILQRCLCYLWFMMLSSMLCFSWCIVFLLVIFLSLVFCVVQVCLVFLSSVFSNFLWVRLLCLNLWFLWVSELVVIFIGQRVLSVVYNVFRF